MLPNNGFNYEFFADVINRPEMHWTRLCNRIRNMDKMLENLQRHPMVIKALNDRDIRTPELQKKVIMKSLLLLDVALGQTITSIFFQMQDVETVISLFPITFNHRAPPIEKYADKDIQLMILQHAFEHVCFEAGGRNPNFYVHELLNRLLLPFHKHKTLFDGVMQRLQSTPKVLQ